jgi:hypothetical protein
MKAFLLPLFIFSAPFISAQPTFLDSLFVQIPLQLTVKQTYVYLDDDDNYQLVSIDTTVDPLDRIEFIRYEIKNYPLQTGAISHLYQKNTLSLFLDSLNCSACPKWESTITHVYPTKLSSKQAYLKTLEGIRMRLKFQRERELRGNPEFYGTQFFLSENDKYNVLTIFRTRDSGDTNVYISYY